MKLKENIYDSIKKMDANELAIIYEHIRFLKKRKEIPKSKRQVLSIDKIIDMTDSSKGSWSETVIEEREERI